MLEVKNIEFSYGNRKAAMLKDFSLNIQQGHIYGLLGKNGAGKSTLLYIMCGLMRAQSGNVIFEGTDVMKRKPEVLQNIFLVPEEYDLPKISMTRFVQLYRGFYPRFSQDILTECLKDFELPMDINLGELSMGQKKKAYMCFALATRSRLFLMDEPTNGLDIPSKSQFRKIVSCNLDEDQTVIISTHQVRDVELLLDQIVIIDNGCLLLDSSTIDICSRLSFEVRGIGKSTDDALFVQPSLQGNVVIVPNKTNADTSLNIELLFNALLTNQNIIEIVNK